MMEGIAMPAVIDEKNREIVFSALLRQGTHASCSRCAAKHAHGSVSTHLSLVSDRTYALAKFNLDTHKLVTIPLPDMFPCAMVSHTPTHPWAALSLSGGWTYRTQAHTHTHAHTHTQAKDVESGTVYALLVQQQITPLAFGTVNTVTGKMHVINTWNNTDLVFPVGSLAAYDSYSAQFYSRT
jgi:hypothetical protein